MVAAGELKKEIRLKLISESKSWNKNVFKQENELIYQKVVKLIASHFSHVDKGQIGLYWPIRAEPDLLKIATNAKSYVGLPKINGPDMVFVKYQPGDYIEKSGLFSLYQPVEKTEIVPKLIIVPGLGFSVQGYRLGYGYGYYDKYLKKISASKPITIGVCFNDNLFEYLPFEKHDYQLDYVVTDKTIIQR